MNIALSTIGILVLGFLLSFTLKQTYNFIFFLSKKPVMWIFVVTVISGFFWLLSALLGSPVSIPAWATTIAIITNLPPRSTNESKELVREIYSEMGLKHGSLLYRFGLGGFAVASIGSWVIFYGQTCNSAGQCSTFF